MAKTPMKNPLARQTVSEKLTKMNYASWKAQVRAAVCGAQYMGYLTVASKPPAEQITATGTDGKEEKKPNLAYTLWDAQDQQVLSFVLTSLSPPILTQVNSCETAADAWGIIEGMFTSQSRAKAVNVRIALASTKKGSMSATDYVTVDGR